MKAKTKKANATLKLLDRKFVRYAITILIVEIVLLTLSASAPLTQQQDNFLLALANKVFQQLIGLPFFAGGIAIFTHNAIPATMDMVPVIGPIFFFVQSTITGLVIHALAVSKAENGTLVTLGLLTLPYSWIELSAYAISVTESIMLILSLVRNDFKREVMRAVKVYLVVLVFLFVAAMFESASVIIGSPGAYITWIPFTLIVVGIFIALMIRRKK